MSLSFILNPDSHKSWEDMSDTKSVKGEGSEEEMEEMEEDENVLNDEEKETMMKNGNDTEITVITGNIEVSCIQKD